MLQIIFFAIFFGIALVLIPNKKTEVVKDFFDGLNDVIIKIIDIIIAYFEIIYPPELYSIPSPGIYLTVEHFYVDDGRCGTGANSIYPILGGVFAGKLVTGNLQLFDCDIACCDIKTTLAAGGLLDFCTKTKNAN